MANPLKDAKHRDVVVEPSKTVSKPFWHDYSTMHRGPPSCFGVSWCTSHVILSSIVR